MTGPDGQPAILSLTYDDALACHHGTVAPALERRGWRGTFFATASAPDFLANPDAWRALAARGHELGNHTLWHPCRHDPPECTADWVKDWQNLAHYDAERWAGEVDVASHLLRLVDGRTRRAFRHPCGNREYGRGARRGEIRPLLDGRFPYARSGRRGTVAPASMPDPLDLPCVGIDARPWPAVREWLEELAENGGWGVTVAHGVGAGTHHLFVAPDWHERMLDWLDERRDRVWVAPFVEAGDRWYGRGHSASSPSSS